MATLVAKTVDPGGTGHYTSMSACEAANFGASNANLTVSDEYCVTTCICTNGNPDTTAVTIAGQTTDATHTIDIIVGAAYRHTGFHPASGNRYRLEIGNTNALYLDVAFTSVSYLSIKHSPTANTKYTIYLNRTSQSVHACVITMAAGATTSHAGIISEASGGTNYVTNTLIHNVTGSGSCGFKDGGGTTRLSNCTIVACAIGFSRNSGTVVVKNNIAFLNTTDYSGSFDAASVNNIGEAAAELAFGATRTTGTTTSATASKLNDTNKNFVTLGVRVGTVIKNTTDTTYTYVTAVDSATVLSVNDDIFANGEAYSVYYNLVGAPTFFNSGAGNYHLVAGASNIAYQTGVDLDSDGDTPVTDDVDGQARHATTPCIGFDESAIYETACTEGAVFADANDYTYVAGGETVEAVAADGVTLTDTPTKILATSQASADGAKFTDTPAGIATRIAATADGLVLADASVRTIATTQASSDGVKLGDSPANTAARIAASADGATFGDSSVKTNATTQAISDGVKYGDAPVDTNATSQASADGFKASDSTVNAMATSQAASDGAVLGDSTERFRTANDAAVDGVAVGDGSANILATTQAATDGAKFTDTPGRTISVPLVASVAGTVSDALAWTYAIERALAEGVVFTDAADRVFEIIKAAVDGVKFGDSPANVLAALKAATDGVKFSEALTRSIALSRSTSDGVRFGDGSLGISLRLATLTDGVIFADVIPYGGGFIYEEAATDGIAFSDATDYIRIHFSAAVDGVVFADATDALRTLLVLATDGLKLSDAPSNTARFRVSASDGVKLAEAVAAAKTRYSSASDGVLFGDYAYRIKATELATGAVDITVTVTKPTVLVTAR